MSEHKPREGLSIKEIEHYSRKHQFEIVFCLAFVLAFLFSSVLYSMGWSLLGAAVGGIIGVLFRDKVANFSRVVFQFVLKQEKTTQLILGVVLLIVAIFLSPLIFLFLGAHGGKAIRKAAEDSQVR